MSGLKELILSKEPALAASLAGSAVAYTLGQLVTHGVITKTQASSTTQQLVPLAVAGLMLVFGVITRHFVHSPASVAAIAALVPEATRITDEGNDLVTDMAGPPADTVAAADMPDDDLR